MFAPSYSRPPYYPSYLPPDARELESLLEAQAWMPLHGQGAANESWKVQHGVYMNESKEMEMKSSDVQRTTHALNQMKKMMAGASKNLAEKKAAGAAQTQAEETVAASSDPSVLVYTDPHAYAHYMERQNVTLFTMFSFQSDKWALLKNTPFMRYIFQGMFCLDIGRLDDENFDTAMQFLERTPNMHTLMLHDGWHLGTAGSKASSAFKSKSRGHPMREKNSVTGSGSAPSGGGGGGGGGGAAKANQGAIKTFPNEKKVISNLEVHLPTFLMRNAHHLVHLELHGLTLTNWGEIVRLLKRCVNLQRLYLKQCNIGDKHFTEMTITMKNQLNSLTAIQLSAIGLTSISASLLCSLIKIQSEKRSTLHWQNYLRQEDTPIPSPSILLPNNLSSQGLISIDVSDNKLGDKGVSLICETLARDTWIKAIDISGNGFGEEALKAIVDMLEENKSLLWIQIQGVREMNVHLGSVEALGMQRRSSTFDKQGRRVTGVPAAAAGGVSSAKLLQQFDPHHKKRSKRLLLLFHQQNIELARFITGRPPVSIIDDESEPRTHVQTKFPSPGCAHIFDRFFKPSHSSPSSVQYDLPTSKGPYAQVRRPASANNGGSKKKKHREPSPAPLLSPMIRGMAAKRAEMDAQLDAATKNNKKERQQSPPHAPPLPPALNFLFPHLHLVCPPEKLMHPDISLRTKPARTDNAWGTKTPEPVKPKPGANENNDPLSQSHFDFRPCLRETCVASTADYIHAEKQQYQRRFKALQEKEGMDRIRKLAAGIGGVRYDQDESGSTDQSGSVRITSFGSNIISPTGASSNASRAQNAFQPLTGLVRKVEHQLSHLGAQVAADQSAAVRSLQEEHERLAKEMDRLEQRQKSGRTGAAPSTEKLVLEHPAPRTSAPATSVADNAQFDLHELSHALTAATQVSAQSGQPTDPALLAYLEQQFQRLHAYMDLVEQQAPQEELEDERVYAAQLHQHQQYDEPDVTSSGYEEHPHHIHARVERVEQSSTPPPATATSAFEPSVTSIQDQRPIVSRDVSVEDVPIDSKGEEPSGIHAGSSHSDRSYEYSTGSSQQQAPPSVNVGQSEIEEDLIEIEAEIAEDLSTAVSERVEQMYGLQSE